MYVPPIGGMDPMGAGPGAGAGARLGAGLRAFLAGAYFAAAFLATTRFFLRAGAAFLAFLPLVFAFAFFAFFAFFAMISLPISCGSKSGTDQSRTCRGEQRSCPCRTSHRRHNGLARRGGNPCPGEPLGCGAAGRPVDQLDGMD